MGVDDWYPRIALAKVYSVAIKPVIRYIYVTYIDLFYIFDIAATRMNVSYVNYLIGYTSR